MPPSASPTVVDAAAAAYQHALGPRFEPSAVAYATGQVHRMAGDAETALRVWLDALEHQSARGWPVMMNAVVDVALTLDQVQSTVDALSLHADRIVELHLWIGVLASRAGDAATAERAFARAEQGTDGEVRFTATTERLRMLHALGRISEAIAVATAALAQQPGWEVPLKTSRAGLWNHAHRPEEALADTEQVLALAPDFAPAWLNHGSALAKLGRHDEAQLALERAVALDPTLAGPAEQLRP